MSKELTLIEAVKMWVRQDMNPIQTDMIAKLMKYDVSDWKECTLPTVGCRVIVHGGSWYGHGEVIEYIRHAKKCRVQLEEKESIVLVKEDKVSVWNQSVMPTWSTMWSFSEIPDINWLEEGNGLRALSECGFRVFSSLDFGYFFGIDGAGYDFYEKHWIPLYKARGLNWHKEG